MINIALAGSTENTLAIAQTLLNNSHFSISWILTPKPKLIGRKKILTKNPIQLFAEKNNIPIILINKKIDDEVKQQVSALKSPDLLLVVDFGYIIPGWLIKYPKIECLNIHPSMLPKYRGSSPGQFVILFGEKKSAVTLMRVADKLDSGDIFAQLDFDVDDKWRQTDYYNYAFSLITKKLPNLLTKIVQNEIQAKPQPEKSPTPVARKLKKEDGFIDWEIIQKLSKGQVIEFNISTILYTTKPIAIVNASKAFFLWPTLWTKLPTKKGKKRMKILTCHLNDKKELALDEVQLEGLNKTKYNEIKNLVIEN